MDYLEIYLCKQNNSFTFDDESYESKIKKVLSVFRDKKFPVFYKQVVKLYHDELILEKSFDDISSQKSPLKENVFILSDKTIYENSLYSQIRQNGTVLKYYQKSMKPLHNFPSTTKIFEEVFEDKTILKINNRLYLNFSRNTFKSEPKRES